jgi:hypothetical protein
MSRAQSPESRKGRRQDDRRDVGRRIAVGRHVDADGAGHSHACISENVERRPQYCRTDGREVDSQACRRLRRKVSSKRHPAMRDRRSAVMSNEDPRRTIRLDKRSSVSSTHRSGPSPREADRRRRQKHPGAARGHYSSLNMHSGGVGLDRFRGAKYASRESPGTKVQARCQRPLHVYGRLTETSSRRATTSAS